MGALERLGIDSASLKRDQQAASATQQQTGDSFGYQWNRRDTYDSPALNASMLAWLVERYCAGDQAKVAGWLAGSRKLILDAGCGAGLSAGCLFAEHLRDHDYLGIDISEAIETAKQRFAEKGYPAQFVRMDLMRFPAPDESVDIIFSEGVLHHTDNTAAATAHLAKKLKRGGLFLFYVYAKKAVIREFTDDYVRKQLLGLSNDQAWEALIPLTKLGQALGKLGVEIDVPEDVPILGIKKGRMDIQRFFYWNVCKAYYRPEFGIDEMNHMNFDWYRPLNCHRHDPDEVRAFCKAARLEIEHMDVQEAGITVVARKV
jgi:arsenite methyltransferase